MIDFTEITLHEPLSDIKVLNSENLMLTDENRLLKSTLKILVIGMLIYWVYKYYEDDREPKTTFIRKP